DGCCCRVGLQIGNAVGTVMGSGRIGMDAEGAGTGFFAADGDVAFAEYRAGIALAVAASCCGRVGL
ncbi:hypothetical protein NEILACOT_05640, partial [Neisseria lactamica ATCC 23970]